MIFLKRYKRFITSWNNDLNFNIYLRGRFVNNLSIGDMVSIYKSRDKIQYSFHMRRSNRLYEILAGITMTYLSVRFYYIRPSKTREVRIEDYKIDSGVYRNFRYNNNQVYDIMGGLNYADDFHRQRSEHIYKCNFISLFDKYEAKLVPRQVRALGYN